ncbi:MAG: hypothetical protein ACRENQ_12980 [Gemmatimonadaceae bacterium]
MIRSRAIRSLPALLLACVATALPWRSVRAQSGLSHLDDATMVPQGEFRLQTIAAWTRFNARFAPAGTAGPTIPLGSEFSFDSLGVAQLPTLTGTQNAIQTLTGSPFRLSLGAMQSAIDARVVVMPISLEYGLFHRLTVGAMLPMVRTRMSIMLRVNPLGTEGNVGVNPASVNPGSLAADSAVVTQLAQAAAALQSTLQGCQANSGSDPSCTQILARQADVTALLQNSAQFAAAFSAVYGANAQDRGSPVVPVSGSPADNLIRTRIAAYDSSFQAFLSTAPRVTAMPAAAGGVVGTADLANLLHNPAIAGFDSLSSTVRIGPGDLELSARYLLLDEFADSTIGANPTGLHSRATVTGILRLPTGQLATASNPLDIATGRGTTAAGARLAFYSQWGTRGGLSMSGSYMQSFGKTKVGAFPSAQGAPFPPSTSDVYPYTPGAVAAFEIAPRFMITRLMGVNVMYDFRHVAANNYGGLSSVPGGFAVTPVATLDGVTMAPGTMQSAGFGFTFSTVTEYDRGRAVLPIDVTFTHLEALSGAARMPKEYRDQVQFRFYYRRHRN